MNRSYWIEHEIHPTIGEFVIGGNTFDIKDDFKTIPGYKWDPARKVWILPRVEMALAVLRKHKISQRIKVLREPFCHTPEETIFVSEDELKLVDGKEFLKGTQFCGYCDSRFGRGGTVGIKRLDK